MKTHKKILFGLSVFIASTLFGVVGFLALSPQKASAEHEEIDRNLSLTNGRMIDGATIRITVNGNAVTFYDRDISNGNPDPNYLPQNINGDVFCGQNVTDYGVNIDAINLAANPLPVRVNLGAWHTVSSRARTCMPLTPQVIRIANPNATARTNYKWVNATTFVHVNGSETFNVSSRGNGRGFLRGPASGLCEARAVIVLTSGQYPNASQGNLYEISANPRTGRTPIPPQAANYLNSPEQCSLVSGPTTVYIAALPEDEPPPEEECDPDTNPSCVCDEDGNCTTADTTCEATWNNPLTWLACPLFNISEAMTNFLIQTFEKQLCFKVDVSETSANTECDVTPTADIKDAWSAIKNVVSAALIIIMLVAIFAQAISVGPIDAYTLRKMLPRLVAAVILIQLSFYIFSWIINLVDDLGEGLGSLLNGFFPGNIDNLNFLLGNAGVGEGTGTVVNWLAIIGIITAVVIALPMVLMFLFLAIVALLVGLAVLVFRKILIVALLLVAPVALLLWVLPTTEQYWKKWWDNFIKVLLLFPLVVLIIEAGRIFAYVAGDALKDGSKIIALFVVMIAFFGPLFILPKAFRWGGSLMQFAGDKAFKASDKLSEKPKDYFKTRQQDWTAERRRRSQERMSGKADYGKYKQLYQRPLDKFRSGAWDPLRGGRGSRNRFEAMAAYQAAGRESSGKTYEAAKNAAQQLFDTAADHDEVVRNLMRGGDFKYIDKKGKLRTFKTPKGVGAAYMRAAGAAGIAKYGTDGSMRVFQAEIDRMRADPKTALLAEEILDENVGPMKDKMDSMYRGFDRSAYERHLGSHPGDVQGATRAARIKSVQSSVEAMKDSWFNGMEAVEAQSLLASLGHDIAHGTDSGSRGRSVELMRKLWQDYESAIESDTIKIAPGVHKAFKAYADGNPTSTTNGTIQQINGGRAGTDIEATPMPEVASRVQGDEVLPDGSVRRRSDRSRVREQPVLDTILNDDTRAAPNEPSNQDMIRQVRAVEITRRFDGNGSPISQGTVVAAGGGGAAAAPASGQPQQAAAPGAQATGAAGAPGLEAQLQSNMEATRSLESAVRRLGRQPAAGPQEGELIVQHRVEANQLDTPGAGGITAATPRNEAYSRNDLTDLRARVTGGETLSAEDQRRLEQLRNLFPDQ